MLGGEGGHFAVLMQRNVGERMKFPPRWWVIGERNEKVRDEVKKYAPPPPPILTHPESLHGSAVNDREFKTVTRTAKSKACAAGWGAILFNSLISPIPQGPVVLVVRQCLPLGTQQLGEPLCGPVWSNSWTWFIQHVARYSYILHYINSFFAHLDWQVCSISFPSLWLWPH